MGVHVVQSWFKGSYTRVWHHLLCIASKWVEGCTCNVEKIMELTKLHMGATVVCEIDLNNDRPFKIPRVLSSSNEVQDSVNQSQLNQVSLKGVLLLRVTCLLVLRMLNKFVKSTMLRIGMRLMISSLIFSWQMRFH